MNTCVIIGAGQMGAVAAELLNKNNVDLLAFGDNDKTKWSKESEAGRSPVLSIEKALALDPDMVLIAIMGNERVAELKDQIHSCGFRGIVYSLKEFYELFDIRSRCMRLIVSRINEAKVPGAIAELGVYRGDLAWQMNQAFPDRPFYLFDTFEGFDERDIAEEAMQNASGAREGDFSETSVDLVLQRFPHPENVIVQKGYFPETAKGLEHLRFAFVSLDPDLYLPTLEGLKFFYPRLNQGGAILLHDYNNKRFSGVRKAVEAYERSFSALQIVLLGDLHGSCVIVK